MDALDTNLLRVWELGLENITDAVEAEFATLLPSLIVAGYVSEEPWGDDSGWTLWRFTEKGVERVEQLESIA
jgi:hypothetical protein